MKHVTIFLAMALFASAQSPPSIQSLMTDAEFRDAGLNKLTPAELARFNRWLLRFAMAVRADARKTAAPPAVNRLSLADLEGAIIIAQDGHPLGLITTNCLNAEALCNEFGPYGNGFNGDSILNSFGTYGNEFSSASPFNEFTSTPPRIYKDGQAIAYLTANTNLAPRVDPAWLLGALKIKR
jgi:hypothetical protein